MLSRPSPILTKNGLRSAPAQADLSQKGLTVPRPKIFSPIPRLVRQDQVPEDAWPVDKKSVKFSVP